MDVQEQIRAESKEKIKVINDIVIQKLGPNWKTILVYLLLFIVIIIIILIIL